MSLFQQINESANGLKVTPEHLRQARGNKFHFIAEIPAEKFLQITTRNDEALQRIRSSCKNLGDYNKWADEGTNIIMPLLDIDIDRQQVTAHEGRHRAAALLCAGSKMIPVSFKLKEPQGDKLEKKYGYWEAKYQAKFEDMPDMVRGEFGRGILQKSDLNVLIDGWDNLR